MIHWNFFRTSFTGNTNSGSDRLKQKKRELNGSPFHVYME